MLDHHIIDEILRRERARESVREELVLEIPVYEAPRQEPEPEQKSERGVLIIEL